VAFIVTINSERSIYIWDAAHDSFDDATPQISVTFGWPEWTPDGRLAFSGIGPEDSYSQIYVWDGEAAINVSQIPNVDNYVPAWGTNGRWAFVSANSPNVLHIHDMTNRAIFKIYGTFPMAWSSQGLLIFCSYENPEGVVAMWDGHKLTEVTTSTYWAQWQSGERLDCVSG